MNNDLIGDSFSRGQSPEIGKSQVDPKNDISKLDRINSLQRQSDSLTQKLNRLSGIIYTPQGNGAQDPKKPEKLTEKQKEILSANAEFMEKHKALERELSDIMTLLLPDLDRTNVTETSVDNFSERESIINSKLSEFDAVIEGLQFESELYRVIQDARATYDSLISLADTRNDILNIGNGRKIKSHDRKSIDQEIIYIKFKIEKLEALQGREYNKGLESELSELENAIRNYAVKTKGLIDRSKTEPLSDVELAEAKANNPGKDIQALKAKYDFDEKTFDSSVKLVYGGHRDKKALEKVCRDLYGLNMEELSRAMDGKAIKFSRREFKDLTQSVILMPDGNYLSQFHKTQGVYSHQVADKDVFIGQGGVKTVSRMEGDFVRQVVHLKDQDLSNAIAATKVEVFQNSDNLIVGHYLTYESRKHPGVIRQVFLAPLMTGGDMEYKQFSVEELASSSLQIAKGLKTMHDNEWAHFDIKPANILRKAKTGQIDVRLMDFDFAENLTNRDKNEAMPSAGTTGYKSPELMNGKCFGLEGACQNDIFGLGVTILENCGFNLWENYLQRPEIIKLHKNSGDDAVHASFKDYMQGFSMDKIINELDYFMSTEPDAWESRELISLACKMIDAADKRPNINQIVAELERIDARVNGS